MSIKYIVEDDYYIALDPDGNEIGRGSKKDKRYVEIEEHGVEGEYRIIQPEVKVGILIGGSDGFTSAPPNTAPQWTGTPAPSWDASQGGTYNLNSNCFDPDGDNVTYTTATASPSFPDGVTLAGTGILTATTSATQAVTSGILVAATDGVAITTSPAFNIAITSAAPGSWLFGTQQATDYIDNWEAWMNPSTSSLGDTMTIYGALTEASKVSWANWESGNGDGGWNWQNALSSLPTDFPVVLGYAMLPDIASVSNKQFARPQSWDEMANGDFDAHYTALGNAWRTQQINNGRDGNGSTMIVTLGWEMTGGWYAHAVGDKLAEFKVAWNRVTNILKDIMPDLRFEFRVARAAPGESRQLDYADIIPTQNVDFFGRSLHDNLGTQVETSADFTTYHVPGGSNWIGLAEVEAAARAAGKPLSLGEWGPQINTCQTSFPASPAPEVFIDATYNWIVSNRDIFGFDVYLDGNCRRLSTRQSHPAAIKYKELWGSEL